jgi:hypothetical protein
MDAAVSSGEGAPRRRGALPSGQASGPAEPRAQEICARDLAIADDAEEVLLDDVRLAFLDAGEPVRDAQAVPHLRSLFVHEVEDGRVAEPRRDQRTGLCGSRTLAEAGWDQRSELRLGCEAARDRGFVLQSDPSDEAVRKCALYRTNLWRFHGGVHGRAAGKPGGARVDAWSAEQSEN